MGDGTEDYAVGYGRPPLENQFKKGKSGNPRGRPRGAKKTLARLLGEALSRSAAIPGPDGEPVTQAEAIFADLVEQAAGGDLKAKRLLFEAIGKLRHVNAGWPNERFPEVEVIESDTEPESMAPRTAEAAAEDEARAEEEALLADE
jgi:hypothetical protein